VEKGEKGEEFNKGKKVQSRLNQKKLREERGGHDHSPGTPGNAEKATASCRPPRKKREVKEKGKHEAGLTMAHTGTGLQQGSK